MGAARVVDSSQLFRETCSGSYSPLGRLATMQKRGDGADNTLHSMDLEEQLLIGNGKQQRGQ